MTIRVVLGEDIDLAREAILHVLEEEDIDVVATCRDSSTHSHRGSGRSLRSKRAVERHIKSIFSKLGLADAGHYSRRVKAALPCLSGQAG